MKWSFKRSALLIVILVSLLILSYYSVVWHDQGVLVQAHSDFIDGKLDQGLIECHRAFLGVTMTKCQVDHDAQEIRQKHEILEA